MKKQRQDRVTQAELDELLERIDRLEMVMMSNHRQFMAEVQVCIQKLKAIQKKTDAREWTTTQGQQVADAISDKYIEYSTDVNMGTGRITYRLDEDSARRALQ